MNQAKVIFMTDWSGQMVAELIALAPPHLSVVPVDFHLGDEQKSSLCQDADFLVITPSDASPELVKACPKVKLIQLLSVGYERIDLETIAALGVPVANNGGANAIPVAEYTIGLMVTLLRKITDQWRGVRERRWRDSRSATDFSELAGKAVGIIGLGRVGTQVAKRLNGWEVTILHCNRQALPSELERELGVRRVSLEELLRISDVVTVHLPLNPETRHFISHPQLALMKPSSVLINTARGPVVDEEALYQCLKERRIAAAGLDVLEQEPTPADNPLLDLDNVVITPHFSGVTFDTLARSTRFAFENIQRVLQDEPPLAVVNQ